MPRKCPKRRKTVLKEKGWFDHLKEGNLKLWWFTISVNTVLTSIACTLAGLGLAGMIRYAHTWSQIYSDHPTLVKEVREIKAEQERVRREYHPATNPNDPPLSTPTPTPAAK